MESKESIKNNNGLKIALFIFIIISVLLAGYIIYDKILNDKEDNNTYNENKQEDESEINEYDLLNIDILSIDSVEVAKEDLHNNHITIAGKMKLSYNEDFFAVGLSGYCLDQNNEKYAVAGPEGGQMAFDNGATEFWLYGDGTKLDQGDTKEEIDWEKVEIKYCKIDELTAFSQDSNDRTIKAEIQLDYEKKFK